MAVYNVLNTDYAGGADPTGTRDSAAPIQAALDQVAAHGGGVLYMPPGDYKLASGLTYSSNGPLRMVGDGPQAARVRLASTSASITYVSISQTGPFGSEAGRDGTVIIEGLSFYPRVAPRASMRREADLRCPVPACPEIPVPYWTQVLCTCFITRSRIYCWASARCGASL